MKIAKSSKIDHKTWDEGKHNGLKTNYMPCGKKQIR